MFQREDIDTMNKEIVQDILCNGVMYERISHRQIRVYPSSTKEICDIVQQAGKSGLKIAWYTCMPSQPSSEANIYIDLSAMDHIVELDIGARYIVVEAGVTMKAIEQYLLRYCPELSVVEVPDNMARTAVAAALKGVPHNRCTLYGSISEMINGLDVVLGDGTEVCIGSGSLTKKRFNIGPLPDLKGLFVNWGGDTGIVAKIALQLLPRPTFHKEILYVLKDEQLFDESLYAITHMELCDYIHVFCCTQPEFLSRNIYIGVSINAVSEREMSFKTGKLQKLFNEKRGIMYKDRYPAPLLYLSKKMELFDEEDFSEIRILFSVSRIKKAMLGAKSLFEGTKFSVVIDTSIIDHSHQAIIRIAWKNDNNLENKIVINKIKSFTQRNGGLLWGTNESLCQIGTYTDLVKSIKKLTDPQNILCISNF